MAATTCSLALAGPRQLALPVAAGNRTCTGALASCAQPLQPAARLQLAATSGAADRRRHRRRASQRPARPLSVQAAVGGGEIVEVADLRGIRVLKNEDDTPRVEYLVKWKDGSPDTWEPAANLADNLLRDYEQRWWGAVKKGEEEVMYKMMEVGGDVLARTVNEDRRSALHFAAAMGKAQLVERLVRAGAEVDLADREGYTPLHMAAGYMHTTTIGALLAGGADPEQADRQGRSPLELVESLRAALPASNPMLVQRRMQLENVIQMLTANLFEDVEPAAVLERRERQLEKPEGADESAPAPPPVIEWLVQFEEGEEPTWVDAKYVSREVVDDFESGLEYAQAEAVVDMRQQGTMRKYLVRWQDDYPDTWEPEEHVSKDLVALFEQQRAEGASSDAGGSSSGGSDGSSSGGNGARQLVGSGSGAAGAAAAAPALQLQGAAS